jgi:hypothetical protein
MTRSDWFGTGVSRPLERIVPPGRLAVTFTLPSEEDTIVTTPTSFPTTAPFDRPN